METETVWREIGRRLRPVEDLAALDVPDTWLWVALGLGVAAVAVPQLWRMVRIGVTVVHELGHGLVGMCVGRTFTGFVLRPDMSGHAVTVGPARGLGRVITTWAGYPAPAVVGAALVLTGATGWAPPVVAGIALVLLLALTRVRSLYTAITMLLITAGAGAMWWFADGVVQGIVLLVLGIVLLLGAWRHLAALWRGSDAGSDSAVLARLTPMPALVWHASFALVLLAATVLVGRLVWDLLVG